MSRPDAKRKIENANLLLAIREQLENDGFTPTTWNMYKRLGNNIFVIQPGDGINQFMVVADFNEDGSVAFWSPAYMDISSSFRTVHTIAKAIEGQGIPIE